MSWYIKAMKKYAVFKGRARRKECWFFLLFDWIFTAILVLLDVGIGTWGTQIEIGVLSGIYIAGYLASRIRLDGATASRYRA